MTRQSLFCTFRCFAALIRKTQITLVLFFCPFLLFSQPYYTKGVVKDEDGNPLQNLTMRLQSSSYIYHTGKDGGFGIVIPDKTDTLILIREGYQQERRVIKTDVFNEIVLKKAVVVKAVVPNKLASLVQNVSREEMRLQIAGNETYTSIVENDFVKAAANPATGLALNVDRASYSNIRRFLMLQSMVPPDAVRIEEMLNYFNLGYTEPKNDRTFGINATLTDCPWNKSNALLFAQIASQKLKLDDIPQSHFVFLIDVSGSMELSNRLELLKSGFKSLVNNLRPVDSVSIVVYGGTIGVALFPTGGNEKEKIFRVIDSLQPGGSTPGESGIKLAYSLARAHYIKGGNNRVILATDGDFNVGLKREDELEEMIVKQRKEGIYLTCLGVGMGNYKDSKIQTLAQRGNGNFAYLDSYSEMSKVLLKEYMQTLYTVADDVYLTVRFDPKYVKSYRLIGFDNKVGAISDVTADLEGGEISPAYSVLAAFEIEPAGDLKKEAFDPVQFLLRYKIPGDHQQCEIAEQPRLTHTPFQQLSNAQKFATDVIIFGSLLRNSKHVKNLSWNDVLELGKTCVDKGDYSQTEFLTLVEQAKKLYGKKRKKEE